MRLLVLRHGPAGDRAAWGASGKDDQLRPLTPDGRRRTREAVRGLARLVATPGATATSPLVRARQTAEELVRALGGPGPENLSALAPAGSPRELVPWLRAHQAVELVAVVGHEPHLGRLVSWLLTGVASPVLELKKGGACLLELDGAGPRSGRLVWMLAPAQLRRIAR